MPRVTYARICRPRRRSTWCWASPAMRCTTPARSSCSSGCVQSQTNSINRRDTEEQTCRDEHSERDGHSQNRATHVDVVDEAVVVLEVDIQVAVSSAHRVAVTEVVAERPDCLPGEFRVHIEATEIAARLQNE